MNIVALKQRVQARDRLVLTAENAGLELHDQALRALHAGDIPAAEAAILRNDANVRALVENLRIYQVELHAQADELAEGQARIDELLNRFSTLFGNMPVAAMLVSSSGVVLEANDRAAQLMALQHRGVAARFLHRMVDSAQYQTLVRPAFLRATVDAVTSLEHIVFVTESGHRFSGELHIAALPGTQDQPMQYACAVIDRTEHDEMLQALRDAADSLRASEAFLSDTARLARIGGWELDPSKGALRWSPQLRNIFELSADAPATLEAMMGLCRGSGRQRLQTALDAAARGMPFEIEIDMAAAGGRPMRVRTVGHTELRDGGVSRVIGVFQDITAQTESRRRIDELTERLTLAIEAGGIGTWHWSAAPDEFAIDERLSRMIAPQGGEPLARLAEAVMPDEWQRLRDALGRALATGDALDMDLHLVGEDVRVLHLTGHAHAPGDGRPSGVLGCARDCTAERQTLLAVTARDAAERASRSKSAFLSRMSHELRTPLNAILGFSQLMRMDAEDGNLVLKPQRAAMIETAARHLLDLVNEVLDVSQIESGRVAVTLADFDLREVVQESIAMVKTAAETAGIRISDDLPSDRSSTVRGDRLRLKEVLINLLSNAVKYNLPNGEVVVAAHEVGGRIEVHVTDNGPGLSDKQLTGLFEPFNRAGAENSGIEGSGMGLYVSRRFAELMDATLTVQTDLGRGCRFIVSLRRGAH